MKIIKLSIALLEDWSQNSIESSNFEQKSGNYIVHWLNMSMRLITEN